MVSNELWIITTLISIGVIGGLFYNWPQTPDGHSRTEQSQQQPASVVTIATPNSSSAADFADDKAPISPAKLLQRVEDGDEYLLVGNFPYAIRYYTPVHELFPREVSMMLRLGLAHEKNDQPEFANNYYRMAEVERGSNLNHRLAAALGIIRCNRKLGKENDSIQRLTEYFLKYADAENIGDKLRFELGYQLATHWREATLRSVRAELGELESLQFEDCEIRDDTSLLLFGSPKFEVGVATKVDSPSQFIGGNTDFRDLSLIQRPSDNLTLMVVSARTRTVPVADLLQQLGNVTGLTVSLPSEVTPYLIGRTVKLESSAMPVAILLDCVLSPIKLAWEQTGKQIAIAPFSSVDGDSLAAFHGRQVVRMGRYLSVNHSDSNCIAALQLTSANIHFVLEQYDNASVLLKQIASEQKLGEFNAKANLTMGLLENRFGRSANAIPLLMAAVDQSNDKQLQAVAYANIGKTHLNELEIQPSIIASSRSLALGSDLGVRAIASLNLARAYMYANDPPSANRVLFENSSVFDDREQDQALAYVIGAFARSLATASPIRRRKAIETTLLSLAGIDLERWKFKDVDRVLLARAYRQAGLIDKAISILQSTGSEANNQGHAVWRRFLGFELASLLLSENQVDSASELYRELASNMTDSIGKQSKLKLANLVLEKQQDAQKCIQHCRELWDYDLSNEMKETTLKTMGHAYNAQGKVVLSSYCFLGMLPDRDE